MSRVVLRSAFANDFMFVNETAIEIVIRLHPLSLFSFRPLARFRRC